MSLAMGMFRYKDGKYPENMEIFNIHNTSPLEADISFCFLNDSKGDTFLLEPPTACLKPGEATHLTVWAYPKVGSADGVGLSKGREC